MRICDPDGVDLAQTEVKNVVHKGLTAFPPNPKSGQECYLSTTKKKYHYNGMAWIDDSYNYPGEIYSTEDKNYISLKALEVSDIRDEILAMNDPAAVEVVVARGSFPLLKDRLNDVDTQLAGKANLTQLQANNLTFKESFATLTALQAAYPTGNAYNHAVLADDFIYTWTTDWVSTGIVATGSGIVDNSVSLKKIMGTNASTNKNNSAWELGTLGATGLNEESVLLMRSKDFIEVLPSTQYKISDDSGYPYRYCEYDINKAFISRLVENPVTTSATTKYIKFATYVANGQNNLATKMMLNLGSNALPYETPENKIAWSQIKDPIPLANITDGSITPSKITIPIVPAYRSINLFDKSTVTPDKYVSYLSGIEQDNEEENASDFIPVLPSTNYMVSGTSEQGAFYNANKTFISGLANMSTMTSTPAECYFIRLSCLDNQIKTMQIELGAVTHSYESFGTKIKQDSVINFIKTNTIDVKQDGSKDFTNISLAIASILDSGFYNRYEIYLWDDLYDVFPNLTASELTLYGIDLPDYVDIISVSGKTVVKGEIPAGTATLDNTTRIAPLNVYKNNKLKGVTVTGRNMRYAIHSETGQSFKDSVLMVENCSFIHYGNDAGMWQYATAWGEGFASGSKRYFKNCIFETYAVGQKGFSCHDNLNFVKDTYHEFDNCDFITHDIEGFAVWLASMGSGRNNEVVFINCRLNGILTREELNNGCGLNYRISGGGNSKSPYKQITTTGNNYADCVQFADECLNMVNSTGATITAKTLVKRSGNSSIAPLLSGDPQTLFLGIVMKDILTGKTGIVRNNGYINIIETNLSTISLGDKVGIVNGVLAVVTTGDYIGICDIAGYIKLK